MLPFAKRRGTIAAVDTADRSIPALPPPPRLPPAAGQERFGVGGGGDLRRSEVGVVLPSVVSPEWKNRRAKHGELPPRIAPVASAGHGPAKPV